MKNKTWLCAIYLIVHFLSANAQQVKRPELDLDDFIRRLSATQQDDSNYEDLYESLMQFYLNPLDINKANADELRSLNILSEIQINNLIFHREKYGKLISLYELQTIDEFDQNTIQSILPFIILKNSLSANSITGIFGRATEHFLLIRTEQTLEESVGFAEQKYLGSPQKLYMRYMLQHQKDFSLGIITEKDQGEASVFDYTSFHFQLMNKGVFKNIIVGDYHLQFGQGLVSAGGYAAGKGAESIYTTRRSDLGIRAHNSVLEGGYYRGAAATLALQNNELTIFASNNARDGAVNTELSDDEDEVLSSILIAGLHRTEAEIAKKGILNESNGGFSVKHKFKNGHLGISALYTAFNKQITRTSQLYSAFEFSGKQNFVIGPNFNYSLKNFNFFGEAARSSSGGIGAVGGFVAALSPQLEWAVNLRNYDQHFHSFYGNAFGEGSRPINERGIYTGFKYTPSRKYSFAAFYDKFSFPWLRYLVDAPSEGHDFLLRLAYKPDRTRTFYLQFHREIKQRNQPANTSYTDFLVNTYRQNLLANYEFSINRSLKTQTRIQWNTFKYASASTSNGFAVIQDLEGVLGRFQLKTRFAWYQTADYDSRIYAYENDVLYAVSFPAYAGKGIRYYAVVKYPISKKIDVWLRAARTDLQGVQSISSGANLIPFPHKTDLKLQLRLKL